MTNFSYNKSKKYDDLEKIYKEVSGPGGLKLTEFIANKLNLVPNEFLLDIGMNRGYQTCFLAKEYGVNAIGIDPWDDREDGKPHIEHMMRNAVAMDISDKVVGLKVGVPDTPFAENSFRAIYSTTTFEMIRGIEGYDKYLESLREVYRILKPGGIFGYAEPMHLDVPVPPDVALLIDDYWKQFLNTLDETVKAFQSIGFKIMETDYSPDAMTWWNEYVQFDPGCRADPKGEGKSIKAIQGRWLSFGYIIARK